MVDTQPGERIDYTSRTPDTLTNISSETIYYAYIHGKIKLRGTKLQKKKNYTDITKTRTRNTEHLIHAYKKTTMVINDKPNRNPKGTKNREAHSTCNTH